MKNKSAINIIILLIIYFIINNFMLTNSSLGTLVAPLILLVISIFSYFTLPKTERRIRYKYEKYQNIIIILIVYFISYFLSGLIFGYEYTLYKNDIISIIKNSYILITPIVLNEYIRNKLVINTSDNIRNTFIISIIFILTNININQLFNNLIPFSSGFKYISVIIIPLIITSFAMTKLTKMAGKKSTITYNVFQKIIPIILPIIPSIPWILTAIISITLPMIIYYNIYYIELIYNGRTRRYSTNSKKEYPLYIIIIVLILFILKVFKYYPVAILSNSMKNTFSKGDTVIVEKVNDINIDKIKEYDIIYYKKNNKYIIHRVVEIINKENNRLFITKGDNNNNKDNWIVNEEDIIGIIKFSIPYIGYPSVWMNDCLNN